MTGLNIAHLDPQQKFGKILQAFGKDIEEVQKRYQKQKNEPPCARMLPPISGKIAWARQLFRKIEQPMLVSLLSTLTISQRKSHLIFIFFKCSFQILIICETLILTTESYNYIIIKAIIVQSFTKFHCICLSARWRRWRRLFNNRCTAHVPGVSAVPRSLREWRC